MSATGGPAVFLEGGGEIVGRAVSILPRFVADALVVEVDALVVEAEEFGFRGSGSSRAMEKFSYFCPRKSGIPASSSVCKRQKRAEKRRCCVTRSEFFRFILLFAPLFLSRPLRGFFPPRSIRFSAVGLRRSFGARRSLGVRSFVAVRILAGCRARLCRFLAKKTSPKSIRRGLFIFAGLAPGWAERCLPPSVRRGWASVPHPPFAAIGLRSRPRSGQSGTNRSAGVCRPR